MTNALYLKAFSKFRSFIMKTAKFLLISMLTVLAISCAEKKEQRVLLFASRKSDFAQSQEAMAAIHVFSKRNNIQTDTTSDIAYLTSDSLRKYGAIAFINLPGDALEVRQQNEIERFVQAGGGLAIIHSQPNTRYQWPWFNEIVGISAKDSESTGTALHTITKGAAAHETTKDLPATWDIDADPVLFTKTEGSPTVTLQTGEGEPVSWVSGERIFFTTLGGSSASYTNENLLKHILAGFRYALKGKALNYAKATTQPYPEENRFLQLVLDTYLDEPIEMEILSDNKVLFIERHGRVKLYDPENKVTKVIATLQVQLEGNYEDGLLGLELDPSFDKNGFVYLYYSPLGGEPVQRLSRFKMEGDSLLLSTEKVVMVVPVQRETCCHSAGNVYFGPDGMLYLSTGDNTSSKESDGFTPIDERPGRGPFDAQKSSGNTHDLRGKILRVKLNEDGTYSIPEGNLFPKDGSQGRPEIYVMGARNPYRITVDKRGYLYWGDVGPDGGEATERGPESYDEWNQARKPGFFGWPYFVADNKAYADFNFATNETGAHFDPDNVVNESPNNYGSKKLPPAQPAMIWYPYNRSKEFPMLSTGSRSAMAGPFYYYEDYQSNVKLPKYYDNKMFIFEWARNWIKVLTFTDAGDLRQIESFLPSIAFWHPIDVKFGKDGAMYVLQYGSNYFARNPDAQLVKIEYAEGNRQPVAQIFAEKTVGAAPLTVVLSAKGSFDYDEEPELLYQWDSGNGQTSSDEDVTFTYTNPGTYTTTLTVTDSKGSSATTQIQLKAGNEAPQVMINLNENSSFYFKNSTITYSVDVNDKEDGTLGSGIDPRAVNFSIDYIGESRDLALLSTYGTAAVSAKFIKGKSLMDASDCKSCHSLDQKSVGPTWLDVAERYRKQGGAAPMLVQKIIKGGSGNWGHAMMAAHPQLSEADTRQMVDYILSLGDEHGGLPLKGTYSLSEHIGKAKAGSYVVSASYTDKGHEITGPLTGRQMYIMRHPKVQAEDFDSFKGVGQQRPVGSDMAYVSDIRDGSYIAFKNIDLKGIRQLAFHVQANRGSIDIRLDSPEGELIGTADLTGDAAGWPFPWRTVTARVRPTEGKHELFFVFRNNESGNRSFMNIDWLEFMARE
jgi:cytochrome c